MKTRILSPEDARSFINNMRWFADRGPVRWKILDDGDYRVTATPLAWSWWCG